jgi:hypothetical protein
MLNRLLLESTRAISRCSPTGDLNAAHEYLVGKSSEALTSGAREQHSRTQSGHIPTERLSQTGHEPFANIVDYSQGVHKERYMYAARVVVGWTLVLQPAKANIDVNPDP